MRVLHVERSSCLDEGGHKGGVALVCSEEDCRVADVGLHIKYCRCLDQATTMAWPLSAANARAALPLVICTSSGAFASMMRATTKKVWSFCEASAQWSASLVS